MYATNQTTMPRPVMPANAECAPAPEIAREHLDLMNDTERLAGTVNELIDRLRPVIRAVPASDCGVGPKRDDCYSELGNGIRTVSERLRVETARLRDLVETLAV